MTNTLRPSSVAFLTVETTFPMTRASCIGSSSYRFDYDQRQVVMLMRASSKFLDAFEERFGDRWRSEVSMCERELKYAIFAEFDSMRLRRMRLRQPVGVEEEQVSFFQMQSLALVLLLIEDSEQQPASFQRPPFA